MVILRNAVYNVIRLYFKVFVVAADAHCALVACAAVLKRDSRKRPAVVLGSLKNSARNISEILLNCGKHTNIDFVRCYGVLFNLRVTYCVFYNVPYARSVCYGVNFCRWAFACFVVCYDIKAVCCVGRYWVGQILPRKR